MSAWFDGSIEGRAHAEPGSIRAAREAAREFAAQAKAENTRRAYRAAVRVWCSWCDLHDLPPLPASGSDVAAFLAAGSDAGFSSTTLNLRRAAIRHLHRLAGCPVPTDDACVSETLSGIRRREARDRRPRKKKAATLPVLARLLAPIPGDLRGLRDRALLLVGFTGALRRSELASIAIADLEHTVRGLRLTLNHSKGSQDTAVTVPIPYGETALCPVRALEHWLTAAGITDGPVFRRIWLQGRHGQGPAVLPRLGADPLSDRAIALIIQARAVAAGFKRPDFGGHSLKRGALTTGMERSAHPVRLKRLGRHKSYGPLGECLEFGNLFDDHPLSGVL